MVKYNWLRFWYAREHSFTFDDYGFLKDPLSEWSFSPEAKTFENISDIPCLILLGEPGIGKSYVIKEEYEKIQEIGINKQIIKLRSYGDESRLLNKINEIKNIIEKSDKQFFYLFLDDFDECRLRIDNLSEILLDELENFSMERLYLRIICRSAEWPGSLEDELKKLWNNRNEENNKVKVYNLTPLRLIDVKQAVEDNKLDKENFLIEVVKKEVVPFAIKPITLNFLIKEYAKVHKLPDTKNEIYHQGCLNLCEEPNDLRRDSRFRNKFSPEKRFNMASPLAAITIFSNKSAMWKGSYSGDILEEDINLSDLYSKEVIIEGKKVELNKSTIEETLDTGLFIQPGNNRIGWAHQSYAEYLAARYLIHNNINPKKIMSLLTQSYEKIAPQLYETSAWLASMSPDIFKEIIKLNPIIPLQGDLTKKSEKEKEELVDKLLNYYIEEKLPEKTELRQYYRKLKHKNLAEQLLPYIVNDIFKPAKQIAILIARECELQSLQEDILKLVINPSENIEIREAAAYSLLTIGDKETKAKFKPLVTRRMVEDLEDELKGIAFKANWPENISAKELFDNLTLQKKSSFEGSYYSFIYKDIIEHLSEKDLLIALNWITGINGENLILSYNKDTDSIILQSFRNFIYYHLWEPISIVLSGYTFGLLNSYAFINFIKNIIVKSWDHLEDTEVLDAFVKIFMRKIKNDYFIINIRDILGEKILAKDKRRNLLIKLIPNLSARWLEIHNIASVGLIINEDFYWLVEQFESAERNKLLWAHLLERTFNRENPNAKEVNTILKLKEKYPIIQDVFQYLFQIYSLDSPVTQGIKDSYYRDEQNKDELNREPEKAEVPEKLLETINNNIKHIEEGNLTGWYYLVKNINYFLSPSRWTDITKLPIWSFLPEVIKNKIIDASRIFIMNRNTEIDKWFGTDKYYELDLFGYYALDLLLKTSSGKINLPDNVWEKWTPIVLFYPWANEDRETHKTLLKLCYQKAKKKFNSTLINLLEQENKRKEKNSTSFFIYNIKHCWDDELDKVLFKFIVENKNLNNASIKPIIEELLKRNVDEVIDFTESLLQLINSPDEDERDKAINGASLLLFYEGRNSWDKVWQLAQKNKIITKNFMFKLADELFGYDSYAKFKFFNKFTEQNLAEIYIYLYKEKEYLDSIDPRYNSLRYYILDYLKTLASEKACTAIKVIKNEIDNKDFHWMNDIIVETHNNYLRKNWHPLSPAELIDFIKDENKRIIQSGRELLDLIIETLEKLDRKLQGDNSRVRDRWNKLENNKYRPQDENEFSNYVKIFLDDELNTQRGIIINREVQIRTGQKTDIYVSAVAKNTGNDEYNIITVIIEVKGCWHNELNTAMESQLADLYLKKYDKSRHGLYLVGWFNCDNWDKDDYRKDDARRGTTANIEEEKKKFAKQAQELSQQKNLTIKSFVLNTALR